MCSKRPAVAIAIATSPLTSNRRYIMLITSNEGYIVFSSQSLANQKRESALSIGYYVILYTTRHPHRKKCGRPCNKMSIPDIKVHGANVGPCRPQVGPMLATWTLLSGIWDIESSPYKYLTVNMNSANHRDSPETRPLQWRHNKHDGVSNHQPHVFVYSTVYSGADQRKHQSSASLAIVRGIHRWPVNSLHKGPGTRKMFTFDDVIMQRVQNYLHITRKMFTFDDVIVQRVQNYLHITCKGSAISLL